VGRSLLRGLPREAEGLLRGLDARAGTAQNSPPPHQPREDKGLLRGYAEVYGKMGNQVSTLRDLASAFSIPLAQM
jgi:hypothetical protein